MVRAVLVAGDERRCRQPRHERDSRQRHGAAEHPLQRPPQCRRADRLVDGKRWPRIAPQAELLVHCSGEAFLTQPGPHTAALCKAITQVTGVAPEQNTGGGTSDARFIARYCPVAEFGLVGTTMHQADERVPVAELRRLTDVYSVFIGEFCL